MPSIVLSSLLPVLHPVPLPILLGLLFAQTGLVVPDVVDRPLQLLGNAMGPMALLLVGATLANARIGTLIGLHGLPLTILVVTASLPIGANVFMFSQRYQVAEELVTASVGVSSVLAVFTVSLTMALAGRL